MFGNKGSAKISSYVFAVSSGILKLQRCWPSGSQTILGLSNRGSIIGEETVYNKINKVHPNALITNPLSACKEALKSLGVKRIGFITPYEPYVTNEMRKNLLDSGLEISVTGSFFESFKFKIIK